MLLFSANFFAQSTGSIVGKITDKDYNNEPLAFANVIIKGTNTGVISDIDGLYTLNNIASGSYTLVFSFVGYETVEIPHVVVEPEKVTSVNTPLGINAASLDEIVIKTTTRRDSEVALLIDQKLSVGIKQNIGSQELDRKGISDVATAITKTTGITKQEGSGTIYVRGLGDRYNSTSINGLPVPSNDPEKKNINLSIFSTDIVANISIDKVYNNAMSGDFAGGNVDIISKDYRENGFLSFGMSSEINTNAFSQTTFLLQQGPNFFGFKTTKKPETLSYFQFENKLNPEAKTPINNGWSLSGGKSFNVGEEGRISFFGTVNFDNDFSNQQGINKTVNAQGYSRKEFDYTKNEYATGTTAMANLGYRINTKNRLLYNFIFINSSNQTLEDYQGYLEDVAPNAYLRRASYVQNTLQIHQLLGEHKFNDKIDLKWGVAHNTINSDMPDRIQNTLDLRSDNHYYFATNSLGDNHRYFHYLEETDLAANVSLDYKFGNIEDNYRSKVTLGYGGRIKERNFEATQFNFRIRNNQAVSINNLDAYFNQENLNNNFFDISTFRGGAGIQGALDPQTYDGDQTIHGVYLNFEHKISPKFTALLGVKGEQIVQEVAWVTQLDPVGKSDKFDRTEILPSLILKYELNDKNNLRFGASKTYTLPQFKERALFIYEDVTEVKVGNPDLYPSENYNADIKWELFPSSNEVVSLTAFGKYIINPINEVTIASASNDISYVNTGDWGYVTGAELEVRKNIFSLNNESDRLSVGFNASYMFTNQELNAEKIRAETNYNVLFNDDEDAFTGASNLLLNGDITFIKNWENAQSNAMATIAYSQYSDRIYAIGTNGLGNQVEKGIGTLDFIFKSTIKKHIGLGFKVGNILDPKIERTQENTNQDYVLRSYRKGMNFSLSLSYKL